MRFRPLLLCIPFTLCVVSAPLFGAADTIAVLPFFNQTHDPSLEWVGESVAETLREALTGAGLLALSREDRVEVYRRMAVRPDVVLTHATVLRIGEALDAGQVIFGRFELSQPPAGSTTSRGQLRLVASFLDRKRFQTSQEFTEVGPVEELSLMESRLAWQAISHLQPHAAGQAEYLKNRPPVRIDAIESYIRGLLSDSMAQKQKLFAQAAQLDAGFTQPAFQLGRMAFNRKDYRTAAVWLQKVAATDSRFHESQFLLALCHFYEGDYEHSAEILQKVAANVPLNEVFNDLGAAELRQNKPDAIDNFRKALDGDEADPDYWFNLGYAQWKKGRVADAAYSFRAVLERTPDDPEAKELLDRCKRGDMPRVGEALNQERIKRGFEETLFLQLQAELKK